MKPDASGLWQDNTSQNPFWKDSETFHGGPSVAVEVMLADGTTHKLPCPKCARGMFGLVKKWRKLTKQNP